MKAEPPRVQPLDDHEWSASAAQLVADRLQRGNEQAPVLNIFRTLLHHPDLLRRWLVFGNHILSKSTLPPRERELVILRVGFLCRSEYEWGQHVIIGRDVGLDDDDFANIVAGPGAAGLEPFEAALLQATDELVADKMISDATWESLSERYSTEQLLDLVFTVGQYNMVSMALKTLGVPLDQGVEGFDRYLP